VSDSLPDLRLVDVTKHFAGALAVDSLSLDVSRGEYVCVLGPSGCGKTTTLRIVAGLEYPDSGRVVVRGVDVTDYPAHRRPVNTVFQHYALFPHMNVSSNIGFGLRIKGRSHRETARAVGEMLEFVSLTGYEDRWPRQLSGGEQQRVALARALINRPVVLLLDEPLGALDKKLRDQMQRELKDIQKRAGVTFVHVTHDQEETMTLADRLAVMEAGRLVQLDTPRAVYDRPANQFVAGFVGEMNFISGTVIGILGDLQIEIMGMPNIRASFPNGVKVGTAVVIGIRPEKIGLRPGSSISSEVNAVQGVVRDVTYLGMRTLTTVIVGRQQLLTVVTSDASVVFPPGTNICASWLPKDTAVFPVPDVIGRVSQ
jgi:spermidine/putrescine transport system ATP-binding protein